MQLDMHYYGTYALARAAGIAPDTATTIATAAQFVDDNSADSAVEFKDGGKFLTEATAHHVTSAENLIKDDQRSVWVPFHFLPGCDGEHYREKLLCKKNSSNAQELLTFAITLSDRPYAPELIGATAHIFADTFAHYDFSGVSCRMNYIDNSSLTILNENEFSEGIKGHIAKRKESFFKKFGFTCSLDSLTSFSAETLSGGLGHGAACTYPDRPYLKWSFVREETDETIEHNNQEDFLEACEELHKFFVRFGTERKDLCTHEPISFEEIRSHVKTIISTPAEMEKRITLWTSTCEEGKITGKKESIPTYSESGWNDERNDLNHTAHSHEALEQSPYRFYQASAALRTFILRDLLPKRGLIVA
ncbi:DUF6765 family protein [Halodesulfovibrio marinisediminis]|uniref:Uncharacterized protein n=1 Tax=Halodesulfovibrio marinisediminis DSM 17456 TaxID=1121457 RepID=A0A1N6DVH0_9BACT|nr:DUF6765 family protein [Halodesulfovibrio marinisediminis]SIN74786.1 hypothetical protein SAMN02745161_0514 [Halodesulfovibrio marinisediminis DSM 17456]